MAVTFPRFLTSRSPAMGLASAEMPRSLFIQVLLAASLSSLSINIDNSAKSDIKKSNFLYAVNRNIKAEIPELNNLSI